MKKLLLFIVLLLVLMPATINAQGTTYYDIVNEIIEKDGIFNYTGETGGEWKGFVYGELIDFDKDGSKEMLIVYCEASDYPKDTIAVYRNVNGFAERIYEDNIGSFLGQTDVGYFITLKESNDNTFLIYDRLYDKTYDDKDTETKSVFTLNDGEPQITQYYAEVEPWWVDYEFNYTYCQKNGEQISIDNYLNDINSLNKDAKVIYLPEVPNTDLDAFINEIMAESSIEVNPSFMSRQYPELDTVCKLYHSVICNNPSMFSEYSIYDIEKDGIPELLLKTGDYEAEYEYKIYTVENNSLKFCGSFNGFHTSLFSYQGNGILAHIGHMGYESVSLVTFENGFSSIPMYESEDSYDEATGEYLYYLNMNKYFEDSTTIKNIFEDKTYDTLVNEVEQYLVHNTEIKVSINNEQIAFDQAPVLLNSRTMVPLRKIFESLGADVDWNQEEKSVISTKDDITIKIKINSNTMFINDKTINLDAAPIIINGRTLVPVRAVAEALNCDVVWDENTYTVLISN